MVPRIVNCADNVQVLRMRELVRVSCARVADGARGGKSIRYRVHHPKIIPQNLTRKTINSSHKKKRYKPVPLTLKKSHHP